MRIFSIVGTQVVEDLALAQAPSLASLRLPERGYLWLSFTRAEFEQALPQTQALLQSLYQLQLMDLHVSDLLNLQLPSRFDYTSQYDLLVFRRLAADDPATKTASRQPLAGLPVRGGPPILRRIDTSPIGFVVFDRVLITVHSTDCNLRDAYVHRLLAASNGAVATQPATGAPDSRSTGARGVAFNPADLMLRIISFMVDDFLALRRELNHQLDHWQTELLDPGKRFGNWSKLLDARQALHQLDELCEDQHTAVQDWITGLEGWPVNPDPTSQHERDLLQVRSRDVLEHIERVVRHVRQLEHQIETAIQIHFNAQSHRTNEIMRTLTVLTAIFLPLNLITGFFGMNFDALPLIHRSTGLWWALGTMVSVAIALVVVFWRKQYLARSGR